MTPMFGFTMSCISKVLHTYNLNIAIYVLITIVTSPRCTTKGKDKRKVTHKVIIIITHSYVHQFSLKAMVKTYIMGIK